MSIRVPKLLYNKYLIASLVFLLLMLWLDQNNWFLQQERSKELNAVNENIHFIKGEISRMKEELDNVNTQQSVAERYAREQYIHKKDEEDVYLIIKDTVVVPVQK